MLLVHLLQFALVELRLGGIAVRTPERRSYREGGQMQDEAAEQEALVCEKAIELLIELLTELLTELGMIPASLNDNHSVTSDCD